MEDTKALEMLAREMELTRSETAALTDALTASRHVMENLRDETRRLANLIESRQRGFWQRLVG